MADSPRYLWIVGRDDGFGGRLAGIEHTLCQQAYLQRVRDIAAKGQVVDEAGVDRLHRERSSGELADPWQTLFAEFGKSEFKEAASTLPYLGERGIADLEVPPRGQAWDGEAEARKFLLDWMQLRDQLRKLAVRVGLFTFRLISRQNSMPPAKHTKA